jgi:hypothetical protein
MLGGAKEAKVDDHTHEVARFAVSALNSKANFPISGTLSLSKILSAKTQVGVGEGAGGAQACTQCLHGAAGAATAATQRPGTFGSLRCCCCGSRRRAVPAPPLQYHPRLAGLPLSNTTQVVAGINHILHLETSDAAGRKQVEVTVWEKLPANVKANEAPLELTANKLLGSPAAEVRKRGLMRR